MILECKLCGGALEIISGQPLAICKHCGATMTIPTIADEQIARRYNDANRLRLGNRFDAAYSVYEEIISSRPKDAEAYWGALLCQYGVEYVLDPHSEAYKPTFHKTRITPVQEDERYLSAIRLASGAAREKYRADAEEIERIRKLYFEISETREPYDIFISYKHTDEATGGTTKDFEIAQLLYDRLTGLGYRAFYAHVSLEDALGEAYEPIIFAALRSAKIMLAVGTSAANYSAEWVKNEWQRFLQIQREDGDKLLIPVYSKLLPSELPPEFAALQAVDFDRVGALEDLLRFVENRLPRTRGVARDQDQLLERARALMREGDFGSSPAQYLDNALNLDPRNPELYMARLQLALHMREPEDLETLEVLPDAHFEWKKAMYVASPEDAAKYNALRIRIQCRRALRCALAVPAREGESLSDMEEALRRRWNSGEGEHSSAENYETAARSLVVLADESDEAHIAEMRDLCTRLAKRARQTAVEQKKRADDAAEETYREKRYRLALSWINDVKTPEAYRNARRLLSTIPEYRDAGALMEKCERETSIDESAQKAVLAKVQRIRNKHPRNGLEAARLCAGASDQPGALLQLKYSLKDHLDFLQQTPKGRGGNESSDRFVKLALYIIFMLGGAGVGFVLEIVVFMVLGILEDLLSGIGVVAWLLGLSIGKRYALFMSVCAVLGLLVALFLNSLEGDGGKSEATNAYKIAAKSMLDKYLTPGGYMQNMEYLLEDYSDTPQQGMFGRTENADFVNLDSDTKECIYAFELASLPRQFDAEDDYIGLYVNVLLKYAQRTGKAQDAAQLTAARQMLDAEKALRGAHEKGADIPGNYTGDFLGLIAAAMDYKKIYDLESSREYSNLLAQLEKRGRSSDRQLIRALKVIVACA